MKPLTMPPSLPSWQKKTGPVGHNAFKPAVPSALKSCHKHQRLRCRAQEGQSSAIGEGELLQSSRILEANGHDCQSHRKPGQTQAESSPTTPLAHAAAPPKSHISNAVSAVSWQTWLAYAEQADAAQKRMEELGISLKESVREEQYRQAAALKAEITALEEQDAVASVQKQLQAALKEERYEEAAALSQSGLTGLQGWWAGQAEEDPIGHLLHVTGDHSRWTGRVFRPRDLAALKVNKASSSSRMSARPPMPQSKPVGSPIFEVFIRAKVEAAGAAQYLHQAMSLQLPSLEESHPVPGSSARASSARHSEHGSEPAPAAPSTGPAVRLRISVHQDGTLNIRPLSVQQPQSSTATSTSARDVAAASASASLGQSGTPDLGSDEVVDIASQNAMSSLEENEESSVTIVSEVSDGLGRYQPSSRQDQEEMWAELARLPASVELLSPDRMVYHVPDQQAGAAQGRLAGLEPGRAAAAAPSSLEEEAAHFEVIVPMSDVPTSVQEAEAAVPMDALSALAEQVAQSLEAKTGCAAARDQIAQAMQDVVQRVAAGEAMSSIDVYVSGAPQAQGLDAVAAAPERSAAAAAGNVTSFFYKRIAVDHVRTDPLTGLFLGSFGPHGAELLQLSRTVVEGEEVLQAVKLTGDPNVPAGLVSFRAKVARKHRMDGRDVYPDQLGIQARYKGEGRVAQKGFSHAKWVDGELLVFNAKGNALTAGAELGFVWAVPGERRFLILLKRVDLS